MIGIPLAAGVFIPFGLTLNPMFGAAAMSLSSFCVVSNALRLNWVDPHDPKKDHKYLPRSAERVVQPDATEPPAAPAPAETAPISTSKEEPIMKKTMKIEGMMCGHCEARVKKALEALPEVELAEVSHTTGTAVVTLRSDLADEALKQAVEAQDYPVLSIQDAE